MLSRFKGNICPINEIQKTFFFKVICMKLILTKLKAHSTSVFISWNAGTFLIFHSKMLNLLPCYIVVMLQTTNETREPSRVSLTERQETRNPFLLRDKHTKENNISSFQETLFSFFISSAFICLEFTCCRSFLSFYTSLCSNL